MGPHSEATARWRRIMESSRHVETLERAIGGDDDWGTVEFVNGEWFLLLT